MTDGETILEFGRDKSRVVTRVGRYVGNEGASALVDLGDQRVLVPFLTGTVPQVNEPVNVWSVDGSLFLVGPTGPKPGVGVILTITGSNAVVRTDFGDFPMIVAPTSPMPSSGDSVGISWSTTPWCTLLVDVPDPVAPPPAPGGGGNEIKSAEFRAIDAGSTDRGSARWWQAQPWASNTTYGAWFYGNQIKDSVPAGAQFVSLEFYASWQQRSGGAPKFALHNAGTKGGVPAFGPTVDWAPGGGWQTPPDPAGWFNALKAGGPYAGVGLNTGGYNKYSSLAQDGMSGALRLRWR